MNWPIWHACLWPVWLTADEPCFDTSSAVSHVVNYVMIALSVWSGVCVGWQLLSHSNNDIVTVAVSDLLWRVMTSCIPGASWPTCHEWDSWWIICDLIQSERLILVIEQYVCYLFNKPLQVRLVGYLSRLCWLSWINNIFVILFCYLCFIQVAVLVCMLFWRPWLVGVVVLSSLRTGCRAHSLACVESLLRWV